MLKTPVRLERRPENKRRPQVAAQSARGDCWNVGRLQKVVFSLQAASCPFNAKYTSHLKGSRLTALLFISPQTTTIAPAGAVAPKRLVVADGGIRNDSGITALRRPMPNQLVSSEEEVVDVQVRKLNPRVGLHFV